MKFYSNSSLAAILEIPSLELFLLSNCALLVELDIAFGQFGCDCAGIGASDEGWLRGVFVMPEWLERAHV